jgi:hypothetical protein
MKKKFVFIVPLVFFTLSVLSQNLMPAPEDKAVVYFVRTSSYGFAINFSYFDSTTLIGVFNGPKYIRYECDSGQHLFWARSENRDFVEAELEAGKIYFIEAIVKMGAVKAGVELVPVNADDPKKMEKIFKLLNKKTSESFTEDELKNETIRLQGAIDRGLEKYEKDKRSGVIYPKLLKSMYYKGVEL